MDGKMLGECIDGMHKFQITFSTLSFSIIYIRSFCQVKLSFH